MCALGAPLILDSEYLLNSYLGAVPQVIFRPAVLEKNKFFLIYISYINNLSTVIDLFLQQSSIIYQVIINE